MQEMQTDWYCLNDDILLDKRSEKQWNPTTPMAERLGLGLLPLEIRGKTMKAYNVIYVDGYGNVGAAQGYIHLLPEAVHIVVGDKPETCFQFDVSYGSIQVFNITLEREISALRTWLVGPVLAAWWKKKTRSLTIGFQNELGVIEMPMFKMTDYDINDCYQTIVGRIRDAKDRKV
jgi:hypothetical protein